MELFLNRVWATLASGINGSTTTLPLTAGHGARFGTIPTGNKVRIVLLDATNNVSEIAYVTAISGDNLTITRGQDGTTGVAHLAGDRIEHRIGKSTMEAMGQIGVTAGNAQQVDQTVTTTTRAATTDFTGESLEGTLSATGVAITAFHGVARITYKRKCLGAGNITAGAGLTILQGGASITTAAGDTFEVYMLTATTCEVRNYQRAVNPKLAETANTTANTANGTANTALTTANTALTTANTANGTANNALAGGHYWQTWQAPSRAIGTTYTNSTGKPIQVKVVLSQGSGDHGFYVGTTLVDRESAYYDAYAYPQLSGIVPNGATYKVVLLSGSGTLFYWRELR